MNSKVKYQMITYKTNKINLQRGTDFMFFVLYILEKHQDP